MLVTSLRVRMRYHHSSFDTNVRPYSLSENPSSIHLHAKDSPSAAARRMQGIASLARVPPIASAYELHMWSLETKSIVRVFTVRRL
jgi:hypothetical protein